MTLSPSRKSPCAFSLSFFDASGGFRYLWRIWFSRSTPRSPFLIGVRTWISKGFASTYFGSFSWISAITTRMIMSASYLLRKKKSRLLLSRTTCSPLLILCAFTTISLSDACRKIFLSSTTGNAMLLIMSRSTFPGPTLGSWFSSPTRISLVPAMIAWRSECISWISTIDISSMIMTSASRGFSAFLSKWTAWPLLLSSSGIPDNSRSLWIVCAS